MSFEFRNIANFDSIFHFISISTFLHFDRRYKLFMQAYISDRLPEAQRGGVPSVFNLVGSFVALNFNSQTGNTIGLQDGHIDGRPLWPMVYYSLRCGSIQSALKCLQQAG